MQKIGYILFRFLIFLLRFMPFWYMYIFSNFAAFIIYYLIRYRRKVVYENLKNSFPEKTEKEITQISKKYYIHLTDLILETLKGFTYPINKLLKHYVLKDDTIYNQFYDSNINFIAVAGHYCNNEWGFQTVSYLIKHTPFGLYKALSNKYIDQYLRNSRNRTGANLVPITHTKRAFVSSNGKPFSVFMIADQNPFKRNMSLWFNFLNQKSAFLNGVESYAKIFNTPVVYFKVTKVKRGYYEVNSFLICDNPKELPKGEITKRYVKLLEQSIIEAPEYYLWSHRRWKLKHIDEQIYE